MGTDVAGAYGLPRNAHLLSALLADGQRCSMSSTGDSLVPATVVAELPQRLFRLQLDDESILTAGLSQEAKRLGIPISNGMRVTVRRAALDPARGTILGPHSAQPLDPVVKPRQPA
jgi:translation initiation factor IF-1